MPAAGPGPPSSVPMLEFESGAEASGEFIGRQDLVDGSGSLHCPIGDEEQVGETIRDLLDMMRHEHRGRRGPIGGEIPESGDEILTAGEIESRSRFVEEHDPRLGHERAGEQHPLTLTCRHRDEAALGEPTDTHTVETVRRPCPISLVIGVPPRFQRSVLGGHDDIECSEIRSKHVGHPGARHSHETSQSTHISATEFVTEQVDSSLTRMQVHRSDTHQGRLSGTVAPEHDPALTCLDRPIDSGQNPLRSADESDTAQLKSRRIWNRFNGRHAHGDRDARLFVDEQGEGDRREGEDHAGDHSESIKILLDHR